MLDTLATTANTLIISRSNENICDVFETPIHLQHNQSNNRRSALEQHTHSLLFLRKLWQLWQVYGGIGQFFMSQPPKHFSVGIDVKWLGLPKSTCQDENLEKMRILTACSCQEPDTRTTHVEIHETSFFDMVVCTFEGQSRDSRGATWTTET